MSPDERTSRSVARLESHLRFYKTATFVLLLLVVLLSAVLMHGGRRKFARAIRIDGELVCLVRDQKAAQRVHDMLLSQGKGELPGDASLEQQWEEVAWPVDGNKVLSVSEAVEALGKRVSVLVEAYTIEVDGTKTIALPSEDFAKSVLDAIKHKYLQEGDKLAEPQSFLQDVKIAASRARADSVVTEIAAAVEKLSQTRSEPKTYTVKPGDFVEKIAADHGMTLQAFYELNPGARGRVIHPGDKFLVAPAVTGITVKTVKEVTRTVEIEPEVERLYSASMPRGETRVVTEGTPGKKLIVEHHTYHNDRLVEKKTISGRVVEPPSAKRVLFGTGERPAEGGAEG